MKSRALVIVLLLTAFFAVAPGGRTERDAAVQRRNERLLKQAQEKGQPTLMRRVALIIGNSAYQNANRLANPVNDAEDIAATLRDLGFELVGGQAHVNQTVDQIKQLILDFGEELAGSGGVGLFYYAGHGVQSQGRNYMIPVEARILREKALEFEGVDVNRVLTEMDTAGNGFNIVILDACRNNPFNRSWRDSSQGLAQLNAPEGTLIAYATSPGKVADDGKRRNGTYTAALLKQMRIPNIAIEQMFKAVRAAVKTATDGQQTPWEATSLVGDFCFIGKCGAHEPTTEARLKPSVRLSSAVVIPHGPINLDESGGVYEVKDEAGAAVEIKLTAKPVIFNNSKQLRDEVSKKNSNASHLWDSNWYYWRLPKDTNLLLAWRNVTQKKHAWILLQRTSNVWWCKTNSRSWEKMVTGERQKYSWAVGERKISISIQILRQVAGWTGDDVKYSFGD